MLPSLYPEIILSVETSANKEIRAETEIYGMIKYINENIQFLITMKVENK